MGNILQTVSSLTALGFAGVGVVVFLFLFLLLMRGKPIDQSSHQLYNRLLTMGIIFAMFCGVLSVLSAWLKPDTHTDILVNFSPSFTTRKLTPPSIQIDGRKVNPGERVALSGGTETIFIGVDDALAEVDSIKQTVQNYSQSVATLTQQRDSLARAVPTEAAPAQATAEVKAAGEQSVSLQGQIKSALATGDFARAARVSRQLNSVAILKPAAVGQIAGARMER